MAFSRFFLHPALLEAVDALGFLSPTPVQCKAIPPAMAGRDVLALAATGTGKTAAFLLPMLQRLLQDVSASSALEKPVLRGLVLAPTRELASQIHEDLRLFARHTHLRSVTVYGGVGMHSQSMILRAGVDIVVACPGRLLDHVRRGSIDLSHISMLVLDEADMMFDMGFLDDVREVLRLTASRSQTMLFSATMPEALRALCAETLQQPECIELSHGEPVATVRQRLCPVPLALKIPLLKHLLRTEDYESVLIFVRTRYGARRLWQQLLKIGVAVTCLQGNLSQRRRQAALDGFKRGTFRVMVATDIAARGIDISQLSHVINFDFPPSVELFVHRAGRTGRAEKSGLAFTFVSPEDDAMVCTLERFLGEKLERWYFDGFDYSARRSTIAGEERMRPARLQREPRPLRVQKGRRQQEEAVRELLGTSPAKNAANTPRPSAYPARPTAFSTGRMGYAAAAYASGTQGGGHELVEPKQKPAFRLAPHTALPPVRLRPGMLILENEEQTVSTREYKRRNTLK